MSVEELIALLLVSSHICILILGTILSAAAIVSGAVILVRRLSNSSKEAETQ